MGTVRGEGQHADSPLGCPRSYRAQVDSTGKISSLLETRLAPTLALTFGGEIDHFVSGL